MALRCKHGAYTVGCRKCASEKPGYCEHGNPAEHCFTCKMPGNNKQVQRRSATQADVHAINKLIANANLRQVENHITDYCKKNNVIVDSLHVHTQFSVSIQRC